MKLLHEFEDVIPQPSALGLTKEVIGAQFRVTNPRDRLVISKFRRMNLPFAIAEWISLITGQNDLAFFQKFISTYDQYSSNGLVVDGAYGPRLSEGNQVQKVIEMLRLDPDSRRAVMTIYNGPKDLNGGGGKNTPCTMSLQFFIRSGKLDLIATMRSSDVVWGVTYDVFQFTMLQEFVARMLNVSLGTFYFRTGSMHIYERDWHYFEKTESNRWPYLMNKMPMLDFSDIEALSTFMVAASSDLKIAAYSSIKATILPNYLFELYLACQSFMIRKSGPDYAKEMVSAITDISLRKVMKTWL